jgi:hypothetical protein
MKKLLPDTLCDRNRPATPLELDFAISPVDTEATGLFTQ